MVCRRSAESKKDPRPGTRASPRNHGKLCGKATESTSVKDLMGLTFRVDNSATILECYSTAQRMSDQIELPKVLTFDEVDNLLSMVG